MNHHTALKAIFLASMALASGSFAASSEVRKCVTETGHVTLTDEVCPSGSDTVKIISGPADSEASAPAQPAPASERASTRMPKRYATMLTSSVPARGLSLDASTLRAARANMHMLDHAAQASRSQRIAALQ